METLHESAEEAEVVAPLDQSQGTAALEAISLENAEWNAWYGWTSRRAASTHELASSSLSTAAQIVEAARFLGDLLASMWPALPAFLLAKGASKTLRAAFHTVLS